MPATILNAEDVPNLYMLPARQLSFPQTHFKLKNPNIELIFPELPIFDISHLSQYYYLTIAQSKEFSDILY